MGPVLDRLHRVFRQAHPDARFAVTLRPSPTGIDGITAGVSLVAPIAHDASDGELEPLKRLTGKPPLDVRIGRLGYAAPGRALPPAVYVNDASPLTAIDVETLGRIFTAGARPGDVRRWSQLGLGGAWANHAIHLYGPRDDGGFASTLRAKLFDRRAFAAHYEPLPSDADILEAVSGDAFAIAIAGFVDPATIPEGVRRLALGNKADDFPSAASYDDVREGRYALSPALHLYARAPSNGKLDALTKEYLRIALSPEGQQAIASLRDAPYPYVPLGAEEAQRELAKLEPQ